MKAITPSIIGRHWAIAVIWMACTIVLELALFSSPSLANQISIGFALISVIVIAVLLRDFSRTINQQTLEIHLSKQAVNEVTLTLETLVNSIDAPIIMIANNERISLTNQALESLTGYSKAQLRGKHYSEFLKMFPIKTEEGDFIEHYLPNILRGEPIKSLIVSITNLEKDNYYFLDLNPITDKKSGEILGIMALLQDITELKLLDQMKDEFIGVVSHELKTPLAVIKGFCQLQLVWYKQRKSRLEESGITDISQQVLAPLAEQSCLEKSIAEVDLMAEMINQMVNTTRIDSGQYQLNLVETDLIPVTEEIISAFSVSLEAGRLVFNYQPLTTLKTTTDPNAYKQVLLNLISNAIKYSPSTTPISISLSATPDAIHLSVEDQGIGIPLSDQKTIFSKFFRTSQANDVSTDGLGLGLYITSRLVKLLGGEISVESRPNEGSTFRVNFPMVQEKVNLRKVEPLGSDKTERLLHPQGGRV